MANEILFVTIFPLSKRGQVLKCKVLDNSAMRTQETLHFKT